MIDTPEIPSIHLIKELLKANRTIENLEKRLDIAENFIRKIIIDWEYNPNHAESILQELHRMKINL